MSKREGDAVIDALKALVSKYERLRGVGDAGHSDLLSVKDALAHARSALRDHRSKATRARKAGAK